MHHPEPEKVFDAPLYFKRCWPPPQVSEFRPEGFDFVVTLGGNEEPFWIYGYSCSSSYPEDKPVEQRAWRETQSFLSVCFSVAEPQGEIGFTPLQSTEEITQQQFEAAKLRNWQG